MAHDYAALAKQLQAGGFSVDQRGRSPKTGVMVAIEGHEKVVPSPVTASRIEEFHRSVEPVLDKTRHSYLGGWEEDGETYLDVSQRFPGREQGTHAVIHREQKAGYDIDRDEDLVTGQQRLFKTDVQPSYPARRSMIDVMGGPVYGEYGLGERRRRADRAHNLNRQLKLPHG